MTDNRTFKLSDVIVGSSVMRGCAGSDARIVMGTVSRILPGICFEVSVGDGTALLWRAYELFTETEATKILEQSDEYPLIVRHRSRAGRPDHAEEKVNFWAVVDCDFWVSQGTEPLFLATASNCIDAIPPSPAELKEELEKVRTLAVNRGANSLAAWTRQMEQLEKLDTTNRSSPFATLMTPPRRQPTTECPHAPIKPSHPRPSGENENEIDDSDYEPSEEEEEEEAEEEDEEEAEAEAEEEDDDTYIPRRNLESIPSLTETIQRLQEFLDTENQIVVSNRFVVGLFVIMIAIFAMLLHAAR